MVHYQSYHWKSLNWMFSARAGCKMLFAPWLFYGISPYLCIVVLINREKLVLRWQICQHYLLQLLLCPVYLVF